MCEPPQEQMTRRQTLAGLDESNSHSSYKANERRAKSFNKCHDYAHLNFFNTLRKFCHI